MPVTPVPIDRLGEEACTDPATAKGATVVDFAEPAVPAISPSASLQELLFRMVSEAREAFLVWRNGPLGLVAVPDVLLAFASGRIAKLTRVEEVMGTRDLYTVDPAAPLWPTLAWMEAESVPLVILWEKGEMRGVLTLAGTLARLLQDAQPRPQTATA